MKTSYKIAWILRIDEVHIDKCLVVFFEGEVTTINEKDAIINEILPVTRYRPSAIVKQVIYTSNDFGVISSTDELRIFLNKELAKDKTRTPVDEQTIFDITKVK